MTRQHLKTILWLRWRMSLNQLRRSGVASKIILIVLAAMVCSASIGLFFIALIAGIFTLPRASPEALMYVWDALVIAFVFFWLAGLLAEVQRSEVLSLQKLLHLPISLGGTFVINYVGSLVSLSLVIFLPGMIGLTIATVVTKGPMMLLVFPLLISNLLVVTAVTYQFQGWIASLMVNKRRRRTVIACVTLGFVLLSQIPNVLNLTWQRRPRENSLDAQLNEELRTLNVARQQKQISEEEYERKKADAIATHSERRKEQREKRVAQVHRVATTVNLLVPLGWLPYGVMALDRGAWLPAILGTGGASLIATASLWRSYRTTIRLYTGQYTAKRSRTPDVASAASRARANSAGLLAARIPGLSETAAVIALANFRSLTRAPEARMLLIGPVIMVLVFGSMLFARRVEIPEIARPFMGFGAIAMVLLSLMQLVGNQFGLDRDGFRALVMSPVPRRDILLGKNLAVAPLALSLGLVVLLFMQIAVPMRPDHFVATFVELIITYLILCMIGNLTSILSPMPVASGSLKPANPKAMTIIVQMLFVLFVFPLVFGLALTPLGIELLVHHMGWLRQIPIYLLTSAIELIALLAVYHLALGGLGTLLHAREQHILSVVTTKVE